MYIIFNKDGSVSESQLTDYINQHSDGVNYIDVSIVGKSVDEYTADGNFKLPNNEVVSLTGSFTNKIKTSTGVYEGYRITLSAVVTEYQGDVALSIQVFNSDKTTLFTYPVTLYVNETTGRGGDPITQDQYEALRAMMADYQLQYARSNMRSYDTLAEATDDLPNLSEGQMILAKETADSETSSVFQKVGDKLEGVSLDALAVDKFLRKHNAQGTGTFTWTDETEGGNVDFKINATASKSYAEFFGEKIIKMMKLSGNPMYKGSANGTTLTLYSSEGDTTQYDDPKIVLEATNKGYSATITPFYVAPPLVDGKRLSWVDTNKLYLYHDFDYFLSSAHKGVADGVATLDANGKIPTSQLPSYMSDVLEFPSFDRFPAKGEVNKIYIALDTNKTYRWGGTVYVEIGSSLALGETSETAYAGDKGKRNADNITALQSGKLDKKTSTDGGTYLYAVRGTSNDQIAFQGTTKPYHNDQVLLSSGFGILHGRNQTNLADGEEVAEDELITKAYGDKEYKSVVKIELTDAQFESLRQNKIAFTQEQAIAIMADGVSTVVLLHNGTSLFKFYASKVKYGEGIYYGLSANVRVSNVNAIFAIFAQDLTAENEPNFLQIPSSFLSGVEFNPTGMANDNVLRFGVDGPLGTYAFFYFDTINGKAVIGEDEYNRKSYYAPETINNTATTKVLTSKSGAFEWSDLSEAGTSVTIRRW